MSQSEFTFHLRSVGFRCLFFRADPLYLTRVLVQQNNVNYSVKEIAVVMPQL